jgi:hypothetical protein
LELVVDAESMQHIGDITRTEDITELTSTKMSQCTNIVLNLITEDSVTPIVINTSSGKSLSSLSIEMLTHIRNNGWQLDVEGNYVIDLTEWDHNLPALILPMRHMNMLDFMDTVKTMIGSVAKVKKKNQVSSGFKRLVEYDSISQALTDLQVLVSEKIVVNITHLEIIMLATLTRDTDQNDSRRPLPGQEVKFGTFKNTLEQRSLAPPMAYQDHSAIIQNPASYVYTNRPDHPTDIMLDG